MKRDRTHFAWDPAAPPPRRRAAASLHGHSAHSLETLAVVATYTERSAGFGRLVAGVERSCLSSGGEPIDVSKLFFRPPLPPEESYEAERAQIEDGLGLTALVSLTDHDTFDGCAALRASGRSDAPLSIEWTVPFGPTYLHLGLHNVAEGDAEEIGRELARLSAGCSACRDEAVACFGAHKHLARGALLGGCGLRGSGRPVADALARVAASPGALVVLNHPMWDMNGLGDREHAAVVGRFMSVYGEHVHALEVNGLRPWSENAATSAFAESLGLPVVSGGDRHGREPAAALNLTDAESFDEFADEVRRDGRSDVLLMPHYREPLLFRKVQAVCDVLRDYPDHTYGAPRWTERAFFKDAAGRLRSLAELWPDGDPAAVRASRRAIQSLVRWPLRPAVRLALARGADTAA